MKISEMIAVLQAAERGEKIEWSEDDGKTWSRNAKHIPLIWDFSMIIYRIAPKKELSLVEELRYADIKKQRLEDLLRRSADRIELLEKTVHESLCYLTTDELLNEIRTRMLDKC